MEIDVSQLLVLPKSIVDRILTTVLDRLCIEHRNVHRYFKPHASSQLLPTAFRNEVESSGSSALVRPAPFVKSTKPTMLDWCDVVCAARTYDITLFVGSGRLVPTAGCAYRC